MRKRRGAVFAIVVSLGLSASAPAGFVTQFPATEQVTLTNAKDALASDPSAKDAVAAVKKALGAFKMGARGKATVVNEVRTVAAAYAALDPKVGSHTELLVPFDGVWNGYQDWLHGVYFRMSDLPGATGLPSSLRKKLPAKIAAAQRAFDAYQTALGEEDLRLIYAAMGTYAKKLDGFTGFGAGGPTWVVSQVSLPQSLQQANDLGFDLDGDAQHHVDNQMASVLLAVEQGAPSADFASIVDARVTTATDVDLLHAWIVAPRGSRPVYLFGSSVATDTDGNTSDNFTGQEFFTATEHPALTKVTATLDSGTYAFAVPGFTGRFGGIAFSPSMPVRFEVTVSDDGNQMTGKVGGVVTSQVLYDLLADAGIDPAPLAPLLETLLAPDIDTDHDGVPDGLSFGFGFSAVRARLTGVL